MKATKGAQKAHADKIIAAVKVLMAYGLPDPVSQFIRDREKEYNRPPTEIDPGKIVVPITQSEWHNPVIDLTATDPQKILLVMFNAAWQQGRKEGRIEAETSQTEALIEAFPKLKDTIRELAEEVADKKIDELRERFRD